MMCAKLFIFLLLAAAEIYAQFADLVDCGKVNIPPMTPAQLLNPLSWTLPGNIAASNCYTGYLVGSSNALNDMYNAMYNAGPPSAVSGATGAAGIATSVPSRVSSRSKSKKNNNGKSKKENERESGKKNNKDTKKKESSSSSKQ